MHWAINRKDHQCLRKILTEAGQTFYKDNMGRTVIHKAAELGCPDAVQHILQLRGDPPAWQDTDKEGRTPLMWAVAANNRATTRCLLHEGCDIDATDATGTRALQHAEALGHTKCAELIHQEARERQLASEEAQRQRSLARVDKARKAAW